MTSPTTAATTTMPSTTLWILILTLEQLSTAQGEFRCSGQKITVQSFCGDTVTLPCQFSWGGSLLPNKYELVWQLRRQEVDFVVYDDDMRTPTNQQQNSMFVNRTKVQEDWGRHGNASIRITDVTESDQGDYTCDLLTLRPYARKICTQVTLIVKTDYPTCCTNKTQEVIVGSSVQLSCPYRLACLPPTKREVTWRFLAANSETEVELLSAPNAADQFGMVSTCANGTLSLQASSATNSGTFYCYLMRTERCGGINLRVLDVGVAGKVPGTSPDSTYLLLCLVPVCIIILSLIAGLVVIRCKPKELPQNGSGTPTVDSSEIPDNACNEQSTQSNSPLIYKGIPDFEAASSKQSDQAKGSSSVLPI